MQVAAECPNAERHEQNSAMRWVLKCPDCLHHRQTQRRPRCNPVPIYTKEIGHMVADRYLHSHHADASEKTVKALKDVLGDMEHLAIVAEILAQLLIVREPN